MSVCEVKVEVTAHHRKDGSVCGTCACFLREGSAAATTVEEAKCLSAMKPSLSAEIFWPNLKQSVSGLERGARPRRACAGRRRQCRGGPVGRGPEDEWQKSTPIIVVDEYGVGRI